MSASESGTATKTDQLQPGILSVDKLLSTKRCSSSSSSSSSGSATSTGLNNGLPLSQPLGNENTSNSTPPAGLCLDCDTCNSDDSVHQFMMSGSTAMPSCAPNHNYEDFLDCQLQDEDDENELEILGTVRTRPPSPRRPIAVTIPFRAVASEPATAALAAKSRQSKKRQTEDSRSPAASSQSSADCSEDEETKRRRVASTPLGDSTNISSLSGANQSKLGRCMSECTDLNRVADSTARIDKAIASIDSLNLIGNSEQTHSLPTVKSLDYGIRSVTADTLAGLLNGQFANSVANYIIVDCRYPFEFHGGHVRGAVNLYRPEVLLDRLLPASGGSLPAAGDRVVIIFHCEFSSQRAPRMARLLRQRDRELNAHNYPQLHYPELYLLQGGYKAFYESHQGHCEPCGYTKMCDPNYSQQLVHFDKLGRAWERQNSRSKHSRLQRLAGSPRLG
ncbi:hypothetical protein BOX15_Mlig022781g2 [Macrostomum lignano]|uniref:M-phase inducer phosphatase n=1 Tax=Macrostomum lignano TaxID=282301 RepID=A0A267GB02_9PLAT|nr:hypothetical protein BOX15_Mlig022781g2 [Macrostomum lignano]